MSYFLPRSRREKKKDDEKPLCGFPTLSKGTKCKRPVKVKGALCSYHKEKAE